MSRRLPPLSALRAFEAAGRQLSFRRAAEELHVTPAAVSHQIRALEEHLGVRLFRRLNRGLLLTDAGQACLPELTDGFDRLAAAVERLREEECAGPLTVTVPPGFAAKWLVPRLERFQALCPEIDVRVSASMHVVDFGREDVDLAVRYGTGDWPLLHVELLLETECFPVCAPALVDRPDGLRSPQDLARHVLLHDDSGVGMRGWTDWGMWLRAAGVTGTDAARGPRFNSANLVLESAAAGRGVALALGVVAAADLAAGRLVRPFPLGLPSPFCYWIVCPPELAGRPKLVAFRSWLQGEAARDVAG